MDHLRPRLVTIGGSTYRHRQERFPQRNFGLDEDEITEGRGSEDTADWTPEEEEKWCLEYLSQDRYKALLDIPPTFYGYLIGKKGSAKRELEYQLGVKITFPPSGGGSEVRVNGEDKSSLMRACRIIDLKVQDLRFKGDWTHFISIPLHGDSQLAEAFKGFINKVSLIEPTLDENIFQRPALLHLTVCVMSLLTEKELILAKETLHDCLEDIVKPSLRGEELSMTISGLQIMNDDPSDTKVLYAKVHSDKLQKIADDIMGRFVNKGISPKQYDSVKLHVTLMNGKFLSPPSTDRRKRPKVTFDATRILQNFPNEDFGSTTVKQINLSKMAADKRMLQGGYYESSHVISF